MGTIISGAAPGYTINKRVHVLTKSKAKLVFVDHDSAATAVKAAEVVGIDPSNVAMLDVHDFTRKCNSTVLSDGSVYVTWSMKSLTLSSAFIS
jgi:hypothetical protein